jgi:hypothetical protein
MRKRYLPLASDLPEEDWRSAATAKGQHAEFFNGQ